MLDYPKKTNLRLIEINEKSEDSTKGIKKTAHRNNSRKISNIGKEIHR